MKYQKGTLEPEIQQRLVELGFAWSGETARMLRDEAALRKDRSAVQIAGSEASDTTPAEGDVGAVRRQLILECEQQRVQSVKQGECRDMEEEEGDCRKKRHITPASRSSPFLSTEAPPNPTGWHIVTDPRDPEGKRTIWASDPKNEVESLSSILVIERTPTAVRYLCVKCKHIFWGSRKRAKEHLLFVNLESVGSSWVRGCTQPLSAEEQALLEREPLEVVGDGRRPSKAPQISEPDIKNCGMLDVEQPQVLSLLALLVQKYKC